VHRSNRLEVLADALAGVVERPKGGVLVREPIIVQSRGMERWVSMRLAERLGVWANPWFPFPRKFLEDVFDAAIGKAEAGFEKETLIWSISAALPRCLGDDEFAELRGYLRDDELGLKRLQLAERIAQVFDQYAVYRPEMVLAWEAGEGESWQALLWRELGGTHFAARSRDFLEAWARVGERPAGVPARVSLFGISSLPPRYMNVLAAMGKLVDVHAFLLGPSREQLTEETVKGHPLLASMARQGREFHEVTLGAARRAGCPCEGRDMYEDPGRGSMLEALQSDILSAAAGGRLDDDGSIVVHSCHGPMRAVEVLRDQLLDMFLDEALALEPRDVIVMTPDIDRYAPFVEAVFMADERGRGRIPIRIADRNVRSEHLVVDAFLAALETFGGRMTASGLLDLLALEPVRGRFGIEAGDLERIRTWVVDSGVRWGVDAEHREAVGRPGFSENTWRFGLDRLLLGYAMPGRGRASFGGVLPYDDIEGGEAELLGRFASFAEQVFRLRRDLATPRGIGEWKGVLESVLESLIESTNLSAWQHQMIRGALGGISERAAAGGSDEPVVLDAVVAHLERVLDSDRASHNFLGGGVTFCALLPMRSIPFKVVCLLGMDDDAFPRTMRSPSFDEIAGDPRAGDRSSREDDRYMFLEALLSARQRLVITYTGRSIKDNSERPPSVVVSELLDALGGGEHEDVRRRLVVRHPLQPFSPDYFGAGGDGRLFSYSRTHWEGASALVAERVEAPPFMRGRPLDAVESEELLVDDLLRYFQHPTRFFLQSRIGLYMADEEASIDDREPASLGPLERYALGSSLLERALEHDDLADAYPSVRAAGGLPLGSVGACAYADLVPEIEVLGHGAAAWMQGDPPDPVPVDVTIGGTRLAGMLPGVWPGAQLVHGYGKFNARRLLDIWIRHLLLASLEDEDLPSTSVLVARPGGGIKATSITLERVDDARARLHDLLEVYLTGQRVALPLFPEASSAYAGEWRRAEHLDEPDRHSAAMRRASDTFRGRWAAGGGESDAYVDRAFGSMDPLVAPGAALTFGLAAVMDFSGLALRIFDPLLSILQEGA